MILFSIIAIWAIVVLVLLISMLFRIVVNTNEVHIVQRSKTSISYWKDQTTWNVYFNWPSWIPFIGITKIILPVSNFNIELKKYEAYDKQKVPFEVDVIWFFRISDPVKAAQRISSFEDLKSQLSSVMNGAIRKVLAGQEIIKIMESRNEISNEFTKEVESQLSNWGVEGVKNVELMDIRDSETSTSKVISNIMIRKTSEIERESRIEVANNKRDAELAEIDAKRAADVQKQDAEQQVGIRTAEKQKTIGIATEQANQQIKIEAKITREKEMDIVKVEQVKAAEIEKEKAIVEAEKTKQTDVIKAEGQKLQTMQFAEGQLVKQTKEAEGKLVEQTKSAEGIQLIGLAEAAAKNALELALIAGQIALAEKIQGSPEYISYLQNIRAIEANEKVGLGKAEALKSTNPKILVNSGTIDGGIDKFTDIFSGKGGSSMASMLENFSNTEIWQTIINKIISEKKTMNVSEKEIEIWD